MKFTLIFLIALSGCSSIYNDARLAVIKSGIIESKGAMDTIVSRQWIPAEVKTEQISWEELIKLPPSYVDEKACVKKLKRLYPKLVDLDSAKEKFKACMMLKGWRLYKEEFTIRPV